MERLIEQYVKYLESDIPASTKFWEMAKKIKNDKRTPRVMIQLEKSSMIWDIARLIHDGVITLNDLEGFSDEFVDAVESLVNR